MAFSDPQVITINTVANTLPRTSSGVDTGAFTKDDGNVKLTVSHSYNKRTRRMLRLDHRKIAPDPLAADLNTEYAMSCYIVVDVPKIGYTVVEQKQIVDALRDHLAANSGAVTTKLLGGEN